MTSIGGTPDLQVGSVAALAKLRLAVCHKNPRGSTGRQSEIRGPEKHVGADPMSRVYPMEPPGPGGGALVTINGNPMPPWFHGQAAALMPGPVAARPRLLPISVTFPWEENDAE